MAEPITIYKLTILNMLDKVDFPLTNTQTVSYTHLDVYKRKGIDYPSVEANINE